MTGSTSGLAPTTVDVAVVGAGIGGLAAAVALRHAGLDAHVFERTPVLSEVGGAVVIREPSVRLLEAWGLHAFHDQAVPIGLMEMRNGAGAVMRTMNADIMGDGQAYSTHRHDVHELLLDALPADIIHLGLTAESVTNDADGERATVAFTDGTAVSARVVVGADGIRSVARKAVVEDDPVFAGLIVLRGMAPASALPEGAVNDRIHLWAEGPRMMTTLPLRGGSLVAMDTVILADTPPEDLWQAEVPTETLLENFAGFDDSFTNMIAAGTVPVRANPVYDREPIEVWVRGRIVLAGDAAHPMAPRQGQGANQAIQDAGALAEGLSRSGLDDPTDGLKFYQTERVATATAMQRASRETPRPTDIGHRPQERS